MINVVPLTQQIPRSGGTRGLACGLGRTVSGPRQEVVLQATPTQSLRVTPLHGRLGVPLVTEITFSDPTHYYNISTIFYDSVIMVRITSCNKVLSGYVINIVHIL